MNRHYHLVALLVLALTGCGAGTTATTTTTGTTVVNNPSAPVTISLTTQTPLSVPSRSNFSGTNMQLFSSGTSYLDKNMQALAQSLNLGWTRFPAGTADDNYNWVTGDEQDSWTAQFASYSAYSTMTADAPIIRGKGLIHLSDYVSFIATQRTGPTTLAGSSPTQTIGVINTFTDTPASAAALVSAAVADGINVSVWELGNEPVYFSGFYPNANSYLKSVAPYAAAIKAAVPSAKVAVWVDSSTSSWTTSVASYANPFWDEIYFHQYPDVPNGTTGTANDMAYFNEFLLNNSNTLIDSDFASLFPANFQVEISEFNINSLKNTLYNAIFVAEQTLRMSTSTHVTNIGMHMLVSPANAQQVDIAPTNDHVTDCTTAYASGKTIDTSTLNFGYFLSPSALALQLINQPINTSSSMWPTAVTGATSIPYNGNGLSGNMPSIFAQAYGASGNVIHLLLTNKDAVSQQFDITVNGSYVTQSLTTVTLSGTDPTLTNTSTAPTTLQLQSGTASRTVTLPPYSVMSVTWTN
jgi:hypothetical protein